jgi:hypothetical protein
MRRHKGLRLAATLCVLNLAAPSAKAQDAANGALGPRLQDATIVGQGSTIVIKRLPVNTPNGVVYRNITIELKLDEAGALQASTAPLRAGAPAGTSAAAGTPNGAAPATATATIAHDVAIGQVTETAALPEVEAPFVAGFYRDVAGGGLVHVINTGRALEPRGFGVGIAPFPTWTLSAIGGDTAVSSAHWYAGPVRTSPNKHLIALAGTTDDSYSYGTVDANGSGNFDSGMLIGAKQAGDELTLVSFHKSGCCTYSSTPTAEITYVLIRGR